MAIMRVSELQKEFRRETGLDYVISGPLPKPDFPAVFRICIGSQENGIMDVCAEHRDMSMQAAKSIYSENQPIFTMNIEPAEHQCQICYDYDNHHLTDRGEDAEESGSEVLY